MSETGSDPNRPGIDAVDVGVEYLVARSDTLASDPYAIIDASLMIQESGVHLPYGGEKMAAFKAAQAARDIVDIRGAEPEDFNP